MVKKMVNKMYLYFKKGKFMWVKISNCYCVFKSYYLAKIKLAQYYLAKMKAVVVYFIDAKQSKTNSEKVVGFLK